MLFFIVEIVSYFLTRRLSALIEGINSNIDKIDELEEFKPENVDDDLGRIRMKFFEMVQRIKQYYEEISLYDAEKRTLELELLQSKINPHFLLQHAVHHALVQHQ